MATQIGQQVIFAAGKTLEVDNTLIFNGTDNTTHTFPSTNSTLARTDAAQTFAGVQTFSATPVFSAHVTIEGQTSSGATGSGNIVFATSPTFGTASATSDGVTISTTTNTTGTLMRVVQTTSTFTGSGARAVGVEMGTGFGGYFFAAFIAGSSKVLIDSGGVISTVGDVNFVALSGGTVNFNTGPAASTNVPTFIHTPAGVAAAQTGWIAVKVAGSTKYLAYWG